MSTASDSTSAMSHHLQFATALSESEARTVLFGANTRGAGFSESARGKAGEAGELRTLFTADFVRTADNESPSLTERLEDGAPLFDAGNLPLEGLSLEAQVAAVRERFLGLLRRGQRAVCLGGDHLIKYAALSAISAVHDDCGVVYLDAHPDCTQDEALYFGSILHHAWQLPHIRPERTSLLALRQVNPRERGGLQHWRPGIIPALDFCERGLPAVVESLVAQLGPVKRVYVSVDLDGLAPHEVPAVEAPYPGGPTLREVLVVLRALASRYELVGMDVSEFIPEFDPLKLTALATARLVKEFARLLP
ncbi:arginase family protein [Archangium lansingense]|uniref:Arginase family protein n=1 Tax=Archangium lansingense TaxID=2995310 RepID=A0ABT3ZUJ5_9BACT|nr:arginase family protein [Archangium lansinium]MCY1072986.1 arginase family protein [Archangium lansinium]